jgi:hypothetical protein
MTEMKHKGSTAPEDAKDAGGSQQVKRTVPPLLKYEVPILNEKRSEAIAKSTTTRVEKNETTTDSEKGAWLRTPMSKTKAKAAIAESTELVALKPATKPEEAKAGEPGPFEKMGDSWTTGFDKDHLGKSGGDTYTSHSNGGDVTTDVHAFGTEKADEEKAKEEEAEKAEAESAEGETATGTDSADTGGTGGTDEKDSGSGEHETGEHESGDSDHGDSDHGDAGGHEGGEEGKDEGEGEKKTPGDWGSDVDFRKALEIIAFAKERREEKEKEGGEVGKTKAWDAGLGTMGSKKNETLTRKGNARLATTAEAEGMAGLRAAAKTLLVASDDELTASYLAMVRAGAFGSAGAGFDATKGRAALSGSVKASGGVGATGTLGATATIDRSGLNKYLPAMAAMFEISGKIGISGELTGNLEARYGPVSLKAIGTISAFAGVAAEAKGAAFFDIVEGIGLSGQVAAMAGAKGKASATAKLAVQGVGEFEMEGGVLAFAGAEAKAKGKASIGLSGIALEGKASAFAGARVTVYGKAGVSIRGREVLKVSGKASVATGAGVEVGGKFGFSGGKLVVEGELAAVLKGGAGLGAGVEIDFAALGWAIGQTVADQWNKEENQIDPKGLDYAREEIDPVEGAKKHKAGYEAVIAGFQDYAAEVVAGIQKEQKAADKAEAKSAKSGKPVKGGEGNPEDRKRIRAARLQKIIQEAAPRLDLRYRETDRGIEAAAQDAFGELLKKKGNTLGIEVHEGLVKRVESMSPDEAEEVARRDALLKAVQSVHGDLTKALSQYAEKKRAGGKHGVKQPEVQAIITDHWKRLQVAFPGAESRHVVVNAVTDTMGAFFGAHADGFVNFDVDGDGQITKFGDPAELQSLADQEKESFKLGKKAEKAGPHLAAIKKELYEYKAKVVDGGEDMILSPDEVRRIVGEHVGKFPKEVPQDDLKPALEQAIVGALTPLVTSVRIGADYAVSKIVIDTAAIGKARTDKKDSAKQPVLETLKTKIEAKRDNLLKKGVEKDKLVKELTDYANERFLEAAKGMNKADKVGKDDMKVSPYEAQLLANVNAAVAPLVAYDLKWLLYVRDGSIAADGVFEEQRRRARSKIEDGADKDNERRALIAKSLRKPFGKYAGELRTALEEEIEAKTSAKPLPKKHLAIAEKARIQGLITSNTSKLSDTLQNAVGDAAVEDAAVMHFGVGQRTVGPDKKSGAYPPMLAEFHVKDLKIEEPFTATRLADLAATKADVRQTDKLDREAREKLVADLAKYLAKIRSLGESPTPRDVQDSINVHVLNAIEPKTPEDFRRVDGIVSAALSETMRDAVSNLEVQDGKVKFDVASGQNSVAEAQQRVAKEIGDAVKATKVISKKNLDTCLEVYRRDNAVRVKFDKAHDKLLAELILKAIGGKGKVKINMAKLVSLKVPGKKVVA